MCEFVETTDRLFTYELIQTALRDDVRPLWEGDGEL